MKKYKVISLLLIALLLIITAPLLSCTAIDPITDSIYIQDLYVWDGVGWNHITDGGGDVVGPAGATDHGLARYDGVTGKLIQDSLGTLLDDGANLFLGGDLSASDINAWDINATNDLDVGGTTHSTGDLNTDSDVNSGNDVNVTNDLDVTDDADIGGFLDVVEGLEVGAIANYSTFAGDGTLTMIGNARTINALWVDAGGIKAPGLKPATAIPHGILETPAWQFANQALIANQETISFSMRIPERMDRSVAPDITIGWSSTTNAGNVKWQLEYLWRSANESTIVAAQETLTVTTAVSAIAEGLVSSTFVGIDIPIGTDVCIHCKITRLSADVADTVADDVELHGVCYKWTSNKLGS